MTVTGGGGDTEKRGRGLGGLPLGVFALIGCLLMIPVIGVVVLIAVAIALPSNARFACRTQQSEAKATLASLFVAEKAFQMEYGFYTTDLVALGIELHENPRYLVGFAEAGPAEPGDGVTLPPDYDPERRHLKHPDIAKRYAAPDFLKTQDGYELVPADLPPDTSATRDGFLAAAVGNPDRDSTSELDVWTIDENRNFRNVQNDCAQ